MGKKVDDSILGVRVGHVVECSNEQEVSVKTQGLLLSQIVYKEICFFQPNPCNAIFDALKTEQQLDALTKDIDEARAILNPLIAMPDGILIEGHSRLEVAKRLDNQGKGLGRLPVRIITTPLSVDEIKQRVYLGNLSRFEIDEDTRLTLYAEIWPDYFQSVVKAGRKSAHGDAISVSDISRKMGKSTPQIKRDAAIYRNACKQVDGRPTVNDIRESRKEMNEQRKAKEKANRSKRLTRNSVGEKGMPGYSAIEAITVDSQWDFSIDVHSFIEYSIMLKDAGYQQIGIVIEYLVERIKKNSSLHTDVITQ